MSLGTVARLPPEASRDGRRWSAHGRNGSALFGRVIYSFLGEQDPLKSPAKRIAQQFWLLYHSLTGEGSMPARCRPRAGQMPATPGSVSPCGKSRGKSVRPPCFGHSGSTGLLCQTFDIPNPVTHVPPGNPGSPLPLQVGWT